MTDRCQIPRCRGDVELIYLDHGVCEKHWMELAAADAAADALRVALGLVATASAAMNERMSDNDSIATKTVAKEETMATKKKSTKKRTAKASPKRKATARKTTSKTKGTRKARTAKAKPAKAPKLKREKVDRSDWVTFALRLPKGDAAAFHAAAGSGRASKYARGLLAAFAAADEAAFRAILKAARQARA